ncbi:SHOCT domain-containing protein [Robertmurraya andreesenii]|uniref:Nicotinic acid phosphoribosyltransferase n=1 Tax=Anoxybacillus andreesenii TaxID=1325932 RepID=A0ABT9V3V5_9BACL|nr:SHOCT domain-containing protein [Robertmurraya andreesenii]MDQ0155631.1 nicotinic acid phosphoribosyltransferase [Robertmurraya andreesenii]
MNQHEDKKVTKISDEVIDKSTTARKRVSQEQLQREFDYIQAEKLLRKMLEKGLITEVEFNKIDALNRQTFSPFLAEIMP